MNAIIASILVIWFVFALIFVLALCAAAADDREDVRGHRTKVGNRTPYDSGRGPEIEGRMNEESPLLALARPRHGIASVLLQLRGFRPDFVFLDPKVD